MLGFGNAQQSGALAAWFDNNYNIVTGDIDKDRDIYKLLTGKSQVLNVIVTVFIYILGGAVFALFRRQFVFAIHATGFLILAIAVLFLVKDHPELKRQINPHSDS